MRFGIEERRAEGLGPKSKDPKWWGTVGRRIL